MNLKQMRENIFARMNYKPNAANYKEMIRIFLNEQYLELCSSVNWLFLHKRIDLQIRKKVEGIVGGSKFINVVTANKRQLSCVGFVPTIEMEGQVLTDTLNNVEYTIISIDTTTIYINKNWGGVTGSNLTTFSISFTRFALPEDCVEPETFSSDTDNWGPIPFISQASEDWFYLNKDETGNPLVVIDDEWIIDPPPIQTMTVTSGTSGSVPTGFTYSQKLEYCYTIYREGRESPPSVAIEYTTPASGNYKIDLANLDNTGYYLLASSGSKIDSGMRKIIYRRDITNNGKWTLIATVSSLGVSFTDTVFSPKAAFTYRNSSFRFSNTTDEIQFDESTSRQYVRFWYIPDTDKTINLRYIYRPKEIVSDTDVPIFGKQYHKILVDLTCQDIFLKNQNTEMFRYHELRAKKTFDAMIRRYLKRDGQDIRFGSWSKTPVRFNRIYGTPSIN